ncbi:MAG: elongation factor Ts [Patescibacteria group bacterium]
MQCKKALEDAGGDIGKALEYLKAKGAEIASKKSERALHAGAIAAYIHGAGSVGSMVHLASETDFVARNEEFRALAHDIAMHVAAMNPEFLKKEDISDADKSRAEEIFKDEVEKSGKPEEIKKKMLSGKIETYFNERTLLEQAFIKNPDQKIRNLVQNAIQKFGENIEVVSFVRFAA